MLLHDVTHTLKILSCSTHCTHCASCSPQARLSHTQWAHKYCSVVLSLWGGARGHPHAEKLNHATAQQLTRLKCQTGRCRGQPLTSFHQPTTSHNVCEEQRLSQCRLPPPLDNSTHGAAVAPSLCTFVILLSCITKTQHQLPWSQPRDSTLLVSGPAQSTCTPTNNKAHRREGATAGGQGDRGTG